MDINEAISGLREDYLLRDGLIKKGIKVDDVLYDEIEDLEQAIISSKVIPELEAFAKTLLADLRCDIYLSIVKNRDGDIKISDEYISLTEQDESRDLDSDASDEFDATVAIDCVAEQPNLDEGVRPNREGFEMYLEQMKRPNGESYSPGAISNYKRYVDNVLVQEYLDKCFQAQNLFQVSDVEQARELRKRVYADQRCADDYHYYPSAMLKHYIGYLSSLGMTSHLEESAVTTPLCRAQNQPSMIAEPTAMSGASTVNRRDFEHFIERLPVTPDVIRIYKNSIDEETIVKQVNKIASKQSMFEVAEISILNQVLDSIDKRYKWGYPYEVLSLYIRFLQQATAQQPQCSGAAADPKCAGCGDSLFSKYVDYSIFTSGTTIPKDVRNDVIAHYGGTLNLGHGERVTIMLNGEQFDAKLLWAKLNTGAHVVQILWRNSLLASYLQDCWPDTFAFIKDWRNKHSRKLKANDIPERLRVKFELFKTDHKSVYAVRLTKQTYGHDDI